MKRIIYILLQFYIPWSYAQPVYRNLSASLGYSGSVPLGSFGAKNADNLQSAFATYAPGGIRLSFELNMWRHIGFSYDSYAGYYGFDASQYQQSLNRNNRGVLPMESSFQIGESSSGWEVQTFNLGMYYYRYFGKDHRFMLSAKISLLATEAKSPAYSVFVSDTMQNFLYRLRMEQVRTSREVFFLIPPFDGIGFEISGRYHLYRGLGLTTSVFLPRSNLIFQTGGRALMNAELIPYRAFSYAICITFTLFSKTWKQDHDTAMLNF